MTAGSALADRVQALSPDDRAYALYWLAHGPDTSVLEDALAAVGRHRSALAETGRPAPGEHRPHQCSPGAQVMEITEDAVEIRLADR